MASHDEPDPVIDLINGRTTKNGECLEWSGVMQKSTLPMVCYQGKMIYIHRYIWEKNNPKILRTEYVMHACGNNRCVSISHLKCVPKKKPIVWSSVWNRLLKHTTADNGCLLWTARLNKGYGDSSFQGRTVLAHRLSWMVKNETTVIPETIDGQTSSIRHLCHRPSCIEPSHLEIGTLSQNHFQDKIDNNTLQRGDRHHAVTISKELASEIKLSKRKKGEDGYVTQKARSVHFGVSIHVVRGIDRGSSWAYVPDRDGNTGSDRAAKVRVEREEAMRRVWTADQFDQAAKKLHCRLQLVSGGNRGEVEGACLEYQGSSKHGYGYITIFGKTIRAHVLACEIKNGRHKRKEEVCRHLCGNRLCCKAEHLAFGTATENAIDTVKQGSKRCKLDETKVRDIRRRLAGVDPPAKHELAAEYNVGIGAIYAVEKNNTWGHVL